jgi:hypothetical protein
MLKSPIPTSMIIFPVPRRYPSAFTHATVLQDDLAKIWQLSDFDQDGKLDRTQFIIAMYAFSVRFGDIRSGVRLSGKTNRFLLNWRRLGEQLPSTLPASLKALQTRFDVSPEHRQAYVQVHARVARLVRCAEAIFDSSMCACSRLSNATRTVTASSLRMRLGGYSRRVALPTGSSLKYGPFRIWTRTAS